MDSLQKELQELRSGLTEVGQALLFLQGFIESDFGMRFQFQAYKSSSPGHEQLAAKLIALQGRLQQHSNQVNPSSSSLTGNGGLHPGIPLSGLSGGHPSYHGQASSYSQRHHHHQSPYSHQQPLGISTVEPQDYQHQHQQFGNAPTESWNPTADNPNSYQEGGRPIPVNVQYIKRQTEDDDCDVNESSHPDGNGDESSDDQSQHSDDNIDGTTQGNRKTSSPVKKKSKVQKKCSKDKEERKVARMRGEAYIGSMKIERGNGKEQRMLLKPVPSRKLGPTCVSTSCIRSIRRDCNRFTEQDRQEIFNEFWKDKDWDEKKAFVCAHVQRINPKRKTVTKGRKSETLFYFLPLNGEQLQVCKNMFVSTTGIGPKMLNTWVRKLTPAPPEESERPAKRKYRKHSEKEVKLPKQSKDGFYKCPYCLELSATRSEFSSHMGKHMSQFVWSNS